MYEKVACKISLQAGKRESSARGKANRLCVPPRHYRSEWTMRATPPAANTNSEC